MLRTGSGAVNFTKGSNSSQKLTVKISDKNNKAFIHEKCSKQKVLK